MPTPDEGPAPGARLRRHAWTGVLVLVAVGVLLLSGAPGTGAPAGVLAPSPRASAPDPSFTAQAEPLSGAAAPAPLARSAVPTSSPPVFIWSNRTVGPQPSPRSGEGLVYDPVLGKVVLFGGWNGSQAYADTWTYLAGTWAELPLAIHPAPRWGMEMVWDPVDREIVLFGGWNWTGAFGDTWVFRGTSWVLIHPVLSPPARDLAGICWDASDGYALMYGGVNITSYNDTWSFVGGNWTPQHSTLSPPLRNGPGFTYVPVGGGYVLMIEGEGPYYQEDVWTYHAGQWTNITTAVGGPGVLPPDRDGMDMIWDPAMNVTLFALGEHRGFYRNDTWTFVNDTFTELAPSVAPPPDQYGSIVWDAADGYVMLFGGDDGAIVLDSTWAWGPPLPLKLLGDSVSTTTPTVGSTVYYSSWASEGDPPYAFTWQLGDGQTTGGAKATHAYSWPGTYDVNLTVQDASGASAQAQFVLTASWGLATPVVATATANRTSGYVALAVAFASNASGGYPGYSAAWKFGDGGSATVWNTTHVYATVGTYTANVTVTDRAGRTGWATVPITVQPLPVPPPPLALSARASPLSGQAPLSVAFTGYATGGKPGYAFSWAFGDGTTAGTPDANHTYGSAGSFSATLTVVDAQGHVATRSFTINATSPGPSPPPPGLLGLPGNEGLLVLVGALVAVVVVAVLAVVLVRRRPPEREGGELYGTASRPAPPPDAGLPPGAD
jgi:PKD repeat protein